MTSRPVQIEESGHSQKRRAAAAAIALTLALSSILVVEDTAWAAVTTVPMGTLTDFSVLAHTVITDTGGTSKFSDGAGVWPGTTITGIEQGDLTSGGIHLGDEVAHQAQIDLATAYQAASQPSEDIPAELSGLTRLEGVYRPGEAAMNLTGTFTLDGGGNPSSVFIIQTAGALGTAASSQIVLVNGAQECNVFWQVEGAVTLGASSVFRGNILAQGAVTVGAGATVHGRAFTGLGDMTLSANTFVEPTCVGVTVTPTAPTLITTEAGGSATFTVVLNTEPTAPVTIGVSSCETSEGTVPPADLTFTTGNWATPQTVTVTGVDDSVDDGDVGYTVILAAAVGGDYTGTNPTDVSATNTDNDPVGVTVTPSAVPLVTTEAGGSATFTVVLNSQPTATVTIGVSSDDPSEGSVSSASLSFTALDWNLAQTVTVTGVNDAVDDGNVAYTVLLAAAVGGDYTGTNPTDVSATNTDNDDPIPVVVVIVGGGGGSPPAMVTPGLVDTSAACPESIALSGFGDVVGFDVITVQAIDCIVHYGISNGTSDLTFNPTGPVSRWQMALFLIRQVQVHGVALPAATDHGFVDIAGYNLATRDAINQLAQLGITRGAGMGIFSPSDSISRWEMALFLIRFASVVGIPPSEVVGSAGFMDMGPFDAETRAAVDQLVQYGIAAGTSSSTFEPAGHVLRWQMALFLTRMLARDGIVPS
jgi:hypothetical protein